VNALPIHIPFALEVFLMSNRVHLVVPLGSAIKSLLFLTAVTGLASLLPALRAARLKPITAMTHFG
jgi:ABC-type antimicrobial peptide transport system permease subunit